MAATQGKRPLSPHLTVYRPQVTSVLSIFHRATGCAMTVSLFLIVWWLLGAATGGDYFAFVDGILTSLIGQIILILSAWAFFYHFCNGIRHLWWDVGNGFELGEVTATGTAVVIGSLVLTAILLIFAM